MIITVNLIYIILFICVLLALFIGIILGMNIAAWVMRRMEKNGEIIIKRTQL